MKSTYPISLPLRILLAGIEGSTSLFSIAIMVGAPVVFTVFVVIAPALSLWK